MQDVIQFGTFIIKVQWLVIAASGMVGYIALRLRLKAMKSPRKFIQEAIFDSLLIIVLVWKLSLILFHPLKVLHNPIILIYFSGGVHGFQLALAAVAAYLLYSSRKNKISIWIYADSITAGFLAGTMVYNLISTIFSDQFMLFYGSQSLLAVLLLFWQMKKLSSVGEPKKLNQLLLWFSIGQILMFYIKTPNGSFENLIFGFSGKQLLFYSLAILSIVVNLISTRKSSNI